MKTINLASNYMNVDKSCYHKNDPY